MENSIQHRALNLARKRTPAALVPKVVTARTRRALASANELATARREMAFLVGAADPDVDLDALSRRYVERVMWRAELRWKPNMLTHQQVDGIEHLKAAAAEGRGVVVNFLHHGQYDGALPSVGNAGQPLDVLVGADFVRPDAKPFVHQHVKVVGLGGNTTFSSAEGSAGILARLVAGRVIPIATDVPGSTPIRFLGRDLRGSFGAARLATTANSPVVVMTAHPDGNAQRVELSEPIEPNDFDTAHDLLAHLVGLHESAVLAWPEAYHIPTTRWGTPN